MSSRVSVVIPALNEEERIRKSVRAAFDAGASEVVVADGGSRDSTVEIARALEARTLQVEGTRARRMNEAFDETGGDIVCFLHADTILPSGACQAMSDAVDDGAEFGGFRLRFEERELRLRVAAFMINSRTSLTREPWGDQAQFFRRDAFLEEGRFKDIPIMEDYDMAQRMKRRGSPVVLPLRVTTSGRRFLELGVLKTAAINWRIIAAWHRGVPPEELRRLYGSR